MNATDDWYDIERVTDRSWRIAEGTIFGSYLIAGDDRAVVIDAGAGIGDLRGMVEGLVDVPATLLLSHTHWDHVGNASQFDEIVADEREHDAGRVDAEPMSYDPGAWMEEWRAAGNKLPAGVDPGGFEIEPATGVESVVPDDEIDLGGATLELLGTPGHARGHLAALDRDAGILYGGDVVHRDQGLYVHFEGCDLHEYVDTFERLIALRDEGAFDTVHVSHARPIAGDDLSILDAFHEGLTEILAGERDFNRVERGAPARRYEIAGKNVLTKPEIA